MIKRILTYALVLLTASCMPEENLPLQGMGENSEYFIECYCSPGKDVILVATKILPIDGNMQYDFPPEMDVSVYAPDKIKLHYLFVSNSKDALCRYQSVENLSTAYTDTLYLDIITANRRKITAKTPVPERVNILSSHLSGNQGTIHFLTSSTPGQNYYVYTLEVKENGEITEQTVAYLDYSHHRTNELIEKSLTASRLQNADQVVLTLKRITEANYHYLVSQNAATSAVQGSITNPVPLRGNLRGALGIFTCYTESQQVIDCR